MKSIALAFDTSNYTTSCAVFDGETGENAGRLLDVAPGQLGLRQSDALYAHVRRLPSVLEGLDLSDGRIVAVGASTKPREAEDSYMPCFLAGASHGAVLAKVLGVPFFEFSHQQGHIAAAAWSAHRTDLLETPHLAWHLSGGTTELLVVRPLGTAVTCRVIGGTSDISAGQLVDRTGQRLGLRFPAGRELDALAMTSVSEAVYEPKISGLEFSLSGVEHKMKKLAESGAEASDVARFVILSVAAAVRKATENAAAEYGSLPVLFSGGVASNTIVRQMFPSGVFAEPRYSADNALGTAILTYRALKLPVPESLS